MDGPTFITGAIELTQEQIKELTKNMTPIIESNEPAFTVLPGAKFHDRLASQVRLNTSGRSSSSMELLWLARYLSKEADALHDLAVKGLSNTHDA